MEINKHFRSEIKDDPEQSPSTPFVYLEKLLLWAANLGLGLHSVLPSFTSNLCWLLPLLDKSAIYRLLKNQCRDCPRVKSLIPITAQRLTFLRSEEQNAKYQSEEQEYIFITKCRTC